MKKRTIKKAGPKRDVYQEVTDKVISMMENCGSDWKKMFFTRAGAGGFPRNATTGKPYSGVNVLICLMSGSTTQEYASYKQWQEKGEQVKKGSKGVQIVFFKAIEKESKTEKDKNGDPLKIKIPLMKYSTVFPRECLESYQPEKAKPRPKPKAGSLKHVNEYVQATGANIVHHGVGEAYYAPGPDQITMPDLECFVSTKTATAEEHYYATLLHELVHWTGNRNRLDRLRSAGFGSKDYAFEELIAELGSAYQCVELGITDEPREDHAKYLNGWIKKLRDDPKAIFKAAAAAQKAVDFIKDFQPKSKQEAA